METADRKSGNPQGDGQTWSALQILSLQTINRSMGHLQGPEESCCLASTKSWNGVLSSTIMQEVTSFSHLEHTQVCYCFLSSAWKLSFFNSNNLSSIANTLNSHFTSIRSSNFNPDHLLPTTPSLLHPTTTLSLHPATPEWCENAVAALKSNCVTGSDKLPSAALIAGCVVISYPLCPFRNSPIACSVFPTPWKCAIVKSLHKGGDHASTTNYRPISLLPVSSKILEKQVHIQLSLYLHTHNLLYSLQSGLCPSHSTQTLLLHCLDKWYKALDTKKYMSAVFLNISKAFRLCQPQATSIQTHQPGFVLHCHFMVLILPLQLLPNYPCPWLLLLHGVSLFWAPPGLYPWSHSFFCLHQRPFLCSSYQLNCSLCWWYDHLHSQWRHLQSSLFVPNLSQPSKSVAPKEWFEIEHLKNKEYAHPLE